ncbi:hypothetical protein QQF64_021412 [Cirrhinus molitorella]|uniref:Uncharacterized protein n=2 Tax=Cirrhinus molitorella TaxID=172907 RepID=A0AA88PFX4_9TELE|nr:hypothetical protein Q8A67_016091 [Cirrhinus molitorella]
MAHNGNGGSMLYSNVLAKGAPPSSDTQPSTDLMNLKRALRGLMAKYPDGVTLSKARRSCPLLLDSKVLDSYASVRQLLESMPDVVTLRGFGVQTFLLPADPRTGQI